MTNSTLGGRIQQARDEAGFTIRQLAVRIGVGGKTLESWESDRSEPRPNKLMMIAGTLGVPVTWLLTGEQTPVQDQGRPYSETAGIAQKLERAISMQQELAGLLFELAADVKRLQTGLDSEDDLAA